jgi:ISXO2-like transposase domain
VVMRQWRGPTVTAVVKHEAETVPIISRRVARGSIVHADEARVWDDLHASFEMKRINHREAYSKDGACTNQAESYIARLRRAEIGQHHHIAGPHLGLLEICNKASQEAAGHPGQHETGQLHGWRMPGTASYVRARTLFRRDGAPGGRWRLLAHPEPEWR